jgi:hypothetical protein
MDQHPNQPQSLSEISHLFLSGIRQKQTQGAPRPMRTPPSQRTDESIDLTPEEFAQVFGGEAPGASEAPISDGVTVGPVRAVLASHLGAQQLTRVQEYASHICPPGKRVGLIWVDASEFRVSIFEHNPHPLPATVQSPENEALNPRRMTECLDELSWDVDYWLLMLPNPRTPEARALLRDVDAWTLLMSCDHDGVVACYRTLKGLADLNKAKISLAMLDAASDADADAAFGRLSSVCQQFLAWPIESEAPVAPCGDVTEHVVLWCSGARDKAQLATAPQWQVVGDFLARARKNPNADTAPLETAKAAPVMKETIPFPTEPIAAAHAPAAAHVSAAASIGASMARMDTAEVMDLTGDAESPAAIVSAVLRGGHEMIECPIKPPMCPDASLAVSRDHRLVLLAVARQGLSDLQQIGRAYQWLIENRALIGMAVPQFAIDAHQLPGLHLLVDHADMSATILQPLLQTASVTVHAYRKLRWGGKTGLLLEAA